MERKCSGIVGKGQKSFIAVDDANDKGDDQEEETVNVTLAYSL